MKEIRITFRDEDFTAVSRSLIELGVIFQVEPLEGGSPADRGPIATRATQAKKPLAKKVTKPGALPSGAGALRAIAERNRTISGERQPEGQGKAHPPGIPGDLTAKLLPYGERQEG
jgi:hypothetical protein